MNAFCLHFTTAAVSLDCNSGCIPLGLGPRCSSAADNSASCRSPHSASRSSLALRVVVGTLQLQTCQNLETLKLFSDSLLGPNHRRNDATRGR